jgi:hypothetical protein
MSKTIKIGTITKEQLFTNVKKANREADIENNMNFNRHRVHTSKKSYSRKNQKNNWD